MSQPLPSSAILRKIRKNNHLHTPPPHIYHITSPGQPLRRPLIDLALDHRRRNGHHRRFVPLQHPIQRFHSCLLLLGQRQSFHGTDISPRLLATGGIVCQRQLSHLFISGILLLHGSFGLLERRVLPTFVHRRRENSDFVNRIGNPDVHAVEREVINAAECSSTS